MSALPPQTQALRPVFSGHSWRSPLWRQDFYSILDDGNPPRQGNSSSLQPRPGLQRVVQSQELLDEVVGPGGPGVRGSWLHPLARPLRQCYTAPVSRPLCKALCRGPGDALQAEQAANVQRKDAWLLPPGRKQHNVIHFPARGWSCGVRVPASVSTAGTLPRFGDSSCTPRSEGDRPCLDNKRLYTLLLA